MIKFLFKIAEVNNWANWEFEKFGRVKFVQVAKMVILNIFAQMRKIGYS